LISIARESIKTVRSEHNASCQPLLLAPTNKRRNARTKEKKKETRADLLKGLGMSGCRNPCLNLLCVCFETKRPEPNRYKAHHSINSTWPNVACCWLPPIHFENWLGRSNQQLAPPVTPPNPRRLLFLFFAHTRHHHHNPFAFASIRLVLPCLPPIITRQAARPKRSPRFKPSAVSPLSL
jgi:hypothetical protein